MLVSFQARWWSFNSTILDEAGFFNSLTTHACTPAPLHPVRLDILHDEWYDL
jgi:hypothetical protein